LTKALDEGLAFVNNGNMRNIELATGEYYHVYNRGVDKRNIFEDESDYYRFFSSLILLNDVEDGLIEKYRNHLRSETKIQPSEFRRLSLRQERPMVDFVAYCLNPNHYHFIIQQLEKDGIKNFMHRLGTSYTLHFNKKHDRSGSLFQGPFKAAHIKDNGKLFYLTTYVNCNSEIHGIAPAENYKWSSQSYYLGKYKSNLLCNSNPVIKEFRNGHYEKSAKDNIKHFKEKKEDERKYFLE
jgi:putative transposase